MDSDPVVVSDRGTARVWAFELIQDMQSGGTDAPARLAELVAAAAAGHDWPEMARIGAFGRAIAAWVAGDPGLGGAVDELMRLSRTDGDDCMLALGLAMRAAFVVDGTLGAGSPAFDADLAEAVVLLEQAGGPAMETVSALTACGIAFDYRCLWELAEDAYAAAMRLEPLLEPGVGRRLLAAVMFNRVEAHVTWASRLRQLGDQGGLAERWEAWAEVVARSEEYGLPDAWMPEVSALGLVMRALIGEDVEGEADAALAEPAGGPSDRSPSHLRLAVALSRISSGRGDAVAAVGEAVEAVDAEMFPLLHELALYLAAEVEAAEGPGAGLRCAQLHIERRWADRLANLEAMRLRISAERMRSELERMSSEVRRDDLTGIGNRRALASYTADLHRSDAKGMSVLMIDVDAFKPVNDRYGHAVGDAVLSRLASVLDNGIRPTDLVIRLGGDEFLVILPGVDSDVAAQRASALMEAIDGQLWSELGPGLRVSVSIGVASGTLEDLESVRARADRAAYRAKRAGGGRISVT